MIIKLSFRNFQHRFPPQPLRVRIVIAGAEGVGKSCIIKRFAMYSQWRCWQWWWQLVIVNVLSVIATTILDRYCEKRFVAKYLPTIGKLRSNSPHIKIANTHQIHQALTMEQPVSLSIRGRWASFPLEKVMYFFFFFFQVSVHIFDTSGLDLFKEVRNEFYRFLLISYLMDLFLN